MLLKEFMRYEQSTDDAVCPSCDGAFSLKPNTKDGDSIQCPRCKKSSRAKDAKYTMQVRQQRRRAA